MKWLMDWWYARMRRIDMQVLWPECVTNACTMDQARATFAIHCFHDRAWLVLGEDEIIRHIDALTGRE